MKIPFNLLPYAYEISKRVYEGEIENATAITELAGNNRMNKGSAKFYIYVFQQMIQGENFTRTLNAPSIEYYLENIFADYGLLKLKTALSSLEKHIEYFENSKKKKVRMGKMRIIYEKYLSKVIIPFDEVEQNEIVEYLTTTKSRSDIIEELKNLRESDPEIIIINHKSYKRDNKTIAQIKFVRDFKCQICGTTIHTKVGGKYIEAAHITAKNQKGRESLNNIILLCPNHHKEFDLGNREIKNHTKDIIELVLNGQYHTILLSVE